MAKTGNSETLIDFSVDESAAEDKVLDPVCGMEIDRDMAAAKLNYRGKTYYFCSVGCKREFQKNPARFIGQREKAGVA